MMRCYSFSQSVCSCESSIINVSWEIIAYIFSSHQSPNRRTKRRKRGTFPPPHWCPQQLLLSKVRKYPLKTAADPSINVGHTLNCQKGLSPGRLLILLPSGCSLPAYLKCFFKSLFHFEERANFSCPSCFNERRRTIPSLHSALWKKVSSSKARKKEIEAAAMSVQKSPPFSPRHERDVRP